MKKIIGIILLVIAVGIVVMAKGRIEKKSFTEPLAEETQKEVSGYAYALVEVKNLDNLKLIANYSQKLNSEEFLAKNHCELLFSGGFYSTDSQPLGLFITEGKTLSNFSTSLLFNGLLSVNDMAVPRITRAVPKDHLRLGLQAGPLLLENGEVLKLILKNDEPARRVVAAVSGENKLYFLTVYNLDQLFDGPNLKDLPAIVMEIAGKEELSFADALNLDGGSASVFIAGGIKLVEMVPVGSVFCQLSP